MELNIIKLNRVIIISLLTLTPCMATAGADFVKAEKTFAGEAELGVTLTTGNTDTSSYKGRFNFNHELVDWENQYLLEGLYKEDTGEVTAKHYLAGAQGNYKMNDHSYWFATANYEVDPFTGYDYSLSGATGYGHRLLDTSKTFLDVEIGPGYIYQRLDSEQALLEGTDSNNSVVTHGVINFETEITETSKFQQRFVADYGDKLDARSETSLTANIIGALAMKFAIIVRYNSEPLDGKMSTDTETNMTLLYSF